MITHFISRKYENDMNNVKERVGLFSALTMIAHGNYNLDKEEEEEEVTHII